MVGLHDSFGERARCFLRHVVTDGQDPVLVFARELAAVRRAVPRRGEWIMLAVNGDRGHPDHGSFLEPILERGVLGLPGGQAQPPPVITDDDGDEVRVAESRGGLAVRVCGEFPGR
jgi:hypothetical protein